MVVCVSVCLCVFVFFSRLSVYGAAPVAKSVFAVVLKIHVQENRAVARKPRDAAAVLFSLKFADDIHYKFESSQASKARLHSSKHTGTNRI